MDPYQTLPNNAIKVDPNWGMFRLETPNKKWLKWLVYGW